MISIRPLPDLTNLRQAAADFRYLLNRGYPRKAALALVGNRYDLHHASRQILHRGVFAEAISRERRAKIKRLSDLGGLPLALDGHNVLITLECAFNGLPLAAADDGFVRDVAELSRAYRISPATDRALKAMAVFLQGRNPGPVAVFYDAPMSKSGELTRRTREIFQETGLGCEALAVPVPEKELLAFPGAVATSDTHVIDARQGIVDLAGEIIKEESGKGRQFQVIYLQKACIAEAITAPNGKLHAKNRKPKTENRKPN